MDDASFVLIHHQKQCTLLDSARLLVVYTENISLAEPRPAAYQDLPVDQKIVYVIHCVLLNGQALEFAFDSSIERALVYDQLLKVMGPAAMHYAKQALTNELQNPRA